MNIQTLCAVIAVATGLACGLAGAGIVALTKDDTQIIRIEGPEHELLTELYVDDLVATTETEPARRDLYARCRHLAYSHDHADAAERKAWIDVCVATS